jgi:hypothetical protein
MMATPSTALRYDETGDEFVLTVQVPSTSVILEARGQTLSEIFADISQQLEDEGI